MADNKKQTHGSSNKATSSPQDRGKNRGGNRGKKSKRGGNRKK